MCAEACEPAGSSPADRHLKVQDYGTMKTSLSVAAALLWLLAAVLAASRVSAAREVIFEPRPKLIPGGPGQKPFDVTRHTIPLSEIRGGGPARGAIPALAQPNFVSGDQMGGVLLNWDRVLGVVFNGVAKAYPVRILNWHELVNDTVAGRAVLVTW